MSGRRSTESNVFERWCQEELSRLLKFQVGEDLVQYLFTIETAKDVKEYLKELLGSEGRRVEAFYREFFRRWHPPQRQPSEPTPEEVGLMTQLVRSKDEEMVLFATPTDKKTHQKQSKVTPPPGFISGGSKVGTSPSPRHGNQGDDVHIGNSNPDMVLSAISKQDSQSSQTGSKTGQKGSKTSSVTNKQKQKFVPLMSAEGQSRVTVQLPGRHSCQCLGQKHALVNNCVECGRIVCSQEGSGPCVFCGALVCTPEEEEILMRDSKKGQKFRDKFLKQFQIREGQRALDHIQRPIDGSVGLNKATQHKDKLLEFDQTSVSRTKVIDDEMDYYAVDSNKWLSSREKDLLQSKEESLREKRHGSRRNKAVTLDFAGRRIVEEDKKIDIYDEHHALEALKGHHGNGDGRAVNIVQTHAGGLYNPSIPVARPEYQETHKEKRRARKQMSKQKSEAAADEEGGERAAIVRLQDRALQEMTDEGKCLSMHQPWASLLVAGIKTCEGRSWYSTHRGRLWIAAAAKKPETEEIERLEQFYTLFHQDKGNPLFPEDYPTSCLLGCVDMVDCLPQEEYCEQYPGGESESPYVFVVENPQQLTVKFPVKGQHKIWTLDAAVHSGAKGGLKPSSSYL